MNLERYISISNVSERDVYAIVQEAANLYLSSGFTKEVKVFKNKKEPNTFLVNFSEATDFERFQYLVTCMPYSNAYQSAREIYSFGYWTISENDHVHKDLYGKRLQLYVSKNDEDGDNVYAIAQDGTETIKLGFAVGYEYEPLGIKEFDFFEEQQIKSDYYSPHRIYGAEAKEFRPKKSSSGCSLVFLFFFLTGISTFLFACKQKKEKPSIVVSSQKTEVIQKTDISKEEIPYFQRDSLVFLWQSKLEDFTRTYKGFTYDLKISKNDHDSTVTDTIKNLQFKNSELLVYTTSNGFYNVWNAIITDTDFNDEISIGIPKEQIENYINSPFKKDTIKIGNLEQTNVFEFQFSDNKLHKIIFEGYID